MKLYYAPGVCSIGIHVLLEEIGKPYDLETVNLREGAQYQPAFTQVSSKSKVPALQRDDGSILTEFPVIATYLAKTNPQAGLIPSDLETELRAYEAMEYAVGTMHGQGFARIFRPGNFGPVEQEDAVKARDREMVEKGFAILEKALAGKNYLGGNELCRVLGCGPARHAIAAKLCCALRTDEGAPGGAARHAAGRRRLASCGVTPARRIAVEAPARSRA